MCLEIATDAIQKDAWEKLLKEKVQGVRHWEFMARKGLGLLTRGGTSSGSRDEPGSS